MHKMLSLGYTRPEMEDCKKNFFCRHYSFPFVMVTVPATINLSNIASARLCESHAHNFALRDFARFTQLKGESCSENPGGQISLKSTGSLISALLRDLLKK